MSVIVSLGIDVFNEKIDDFAAKRLQYQMTKKKNPKKGSKLEIQESFQTNATILIKFYAYLGICKGL